MIWAIGTTDVNDEKSIGEICALENKNSYLNNVQIIQLVTTAVVKD